MLLSSIVYIDLQRRSKEMHYDPKCLKAKHKCLKVCIHESCNINNPFICDTCGNHHPKECQVIQYKQLIQKLHKLQGINKHELYRYQDYVEQTFTTLIKSLQSEFVKFRQQFQHINASNRIMEFYQLLKSHKEHKLKGNFLYNMLHQQLALKNNYKLKSQAELWSLSQEIIELQKHVNVKLPYYYSIYGYDQQNKPIEEVNLDIPPGNPMKQVQIKYRYNRNQLKGGLLQHNMNVVEKLFDKEIYNIQLLYKASRSMYSAQIFHQICDGKKNTLTIAKTQFGNLVGGFCAIPWRSPNTWEYEEDPLGQTFIFSLGRYLQGLRFVPFKKDFSIGMHREYGPCFGDDLVIYDKSSTSKNCWSNFPDCYRCKQREIQHSQKTIREWVGVNDHYKKFNIVEWQVYKISFNQAQQVKVERSFMEQYRKI